MSWKTRINFKLQRAVRSSAWYTQTQFPDCAKFWNLDTFNLDIVNLGSTSALRAFDYTGLPVKAANWALRRHYLSGDRAILENYLSFLKPGATVLIPLCPFSSLSGRYPVSGDRYYTLLYPNSIPNFSKTRQMEVADIQRNPMRRIPAFQVYLELRHKATSLIRRPRANVPSEAFLAKNAETWLTDWLREFSMKDLASPLSLLNRDAIEDAVVHLNAIIATCREHQFNPVLVFPPMYHALASKFTPEARQMLIGSMVSRLDDKNVRFLNHMDDPAFVHDASLFVDAYLMNEKGAKAFTRKILEEVNLI